ncbi:hypothetical protein V6N11_012387 [Hibiscus sabdariffa]|uniref:Uncharacterized protein n=2 Tax=Hibiscus sabdariffa TaxID=183260 RepID=A0ABR2QAZ8_9ROSI
MSQSLMSLDLGVMVVVTDVMDLNAPQSMRHFSYVMTSNVEEVSADAKDVSVQGMPLFEVPSMSSFWDMVRGSNGSLPHDNLTSDMNADLHENDVIIG